MSFGIGVADIVEALHFVKVTYDSWKDAPEKYRSIKQRLHSLRGPLQRLATHYEYSHGRTSRSSMRASQRDLDNILSSIEDTLNQLDRIINKRAELKFWDRLRLSSHQISDLSSALDRHIQDLTCLCTSLGLDNDRHIRHGQQTLQTGQQDLKRGQDELLRLVGQLLPPKVPLATVEAVVETVDSVSMSSSFMTEYGDEDDPAVWREFRRKAIAEGITSRELEVYQEQLHDILRTVAGKRRSRRRSRSQSRSHGRADSCVQSGSVWADERLDREHRDGSHRRFLDPPPRYYSRSPSPRRDSRHRRQINAAPASWRQSELLGPASDFSTELTRERSRRRRRRRSHSVETESRSEVTFVSRTRSSDREQY